MPLSLIALVLTGLVACAHVGFMVLEMVWWDRPAGRRIFNLTPEGAAATKQLAANQGLYNGFLAAGLIWALASGRLDLKVFFLGCVIVAGLFGALTVKRSILYIQALPAIAALAAVLSA